jgi:hypothetical protein
MENKDKYLNENKILNICSLIIRFYFVCGFLRFWENISFRRFEQIKPGFGRNVCSLIYWTTKGKGKKGQEAKAERRKAKKDIYSCREKTTWCTTYSYYTSSTFTCFGRI